MPLMWTRSFKEHSEDAGWESLGIVVVLDGATPLDRSPAMNLATHRLAADVAKELGRRSPAPGHLREAAVAAIAGAQRGFGATATLSCAVWDDHHLELLTIADSALLIRTAAGVEVIRDPAFEGREEAALQSVLRDIGAGRTPEEAYAAIRSNERRGRAARNTADGLWVVSDSHDPQEVIAHAHHEIRPVTGVLEMAAVTDGILAVVDTFGLTDWDRLLAAARDNRIGELMAQADRLEEQDPARVRYPRFSPRDDATIAFATLG